MRLSAVDKLKLIKKALSGEKVTYLAKEAGVSRKTFYSWLKKYRSARPNLAHVALSDKRLKRRFYYKSLHPKERLLIIGKAQYKQSLKSSLSPQERAAGLKEASIAQLCREIGISRKTYYKWQKRYQQDG